MTSTKTVNPQLMIDDPAVERAGLVHRVREPAGPGPHPAVVMLHGRSGDEAVTWVFAPLLPSDWLIVAPRGLTQDPDGGYTWLPRKSDEWPALPTFDPAVAAVLKLIAALPELYHADPGRIYLMGFSQGAALAYALALHRPELVRGVAGLVGFMPEGVDDVVRRAPLDGLPVFMAVGQNDPMIPLSRARDCAQQLRQAGAALEAHEYATGHRLTAQGMRDLKRWWQARSGK